MKLPAFQFYPGDWRKDVGVQSLDYEARGIWFEILCLMHESERRGVLILNGRSMPDEALSRLLGVTPDLLKQNLSKIEAHGVASREPDTGALVCRRMVRDENLRKVRAEAGKKGGNPVLLKQKTTTSVKQKPTPSSSVSTSEERTVIPLLLSTEEFKAAWVDWLQHRREKKEPIKPGSQTERQQLKTLESWGTARAIAAIRHTIFKGWVGIREPDSNDRPGPTGNGGASPPARIVKPARPMEGEVGYRAND